MLVRMTDEPDDYEGNWPRDDAMTEWVLVPREPTAKQLIDGAYEVPDPISHRGELTARMVYRAMLDAAPAAPQQAEPVALIESLQRRYGVSFLGSEKALQHFARDWVFLTTPQEPAAEVQRLREALKPFAAIDLTTNQAVDAMDVLRARRALEGK